jgi:tetratricopeptide (TPR) repeat protein
MRRVILVAAILAACLSMGRAPNAASNDLLARQAAEAYEAGNYGKAARLYRMLRDAGTRGPDVHYDLGNCYLKEGDLGRAILEYQRSLKDDPHLKPALHNLEVARRLLPARVAMWQPSPWESAVRDLPPGLLEIVVLVFVFLGNAFLTALLFLGPGRARRTCAQALVAAFVVAAAAGGLIAYADAVLPSHKPAVIVEAAKVYPQPERKGKPLAELPPGSEVVEVSTAGNWKLVLWGEGRGWTDSRAVEVP